MKFSRPSILLRSLAWPALAMMAMTSPQAWAAYSCSVSANSTGTLYDAPTPQDSQGLATLTCTRDSGDANTLSYRLKADNGLHATGNQRRVRLGATNNFLQYSLTRSATCGNNSNWYAPAAGNGNVLRGTLNFGAALSQSVSVPYCLRTRVASGGNPAAPTAGVYTDTINIFAQYPGSNAGVLSPVAPITYSVGVNNQCVFRSFPTNMAFNYIAFSPTQQQALTSFNLRCSNALPWGVTVSPANGVVLGLAYSIASSPTTMIGTGADQAVTLTGTMPAGQAGSCSLGTCTGSNVHTVTITY